MPSGPTRSHLVFWPDVTHVNPYQRLLAESLPDGWTAAAGRIDAALEQATAAGAPRVVFHQHWTTPVTVGAETEAAAAAACAAHLDKLRRLRDAGGAVLWTVHNVLSHEHTFPAVEAALHQDLAALATAVHVHSPHALARMAPHYTVPADTVVVAPHPSYIGAYPDTVTREEARTTLGVAAHETLFVFVGMIRPYKGLDDLLLAFARLRATEPDAHLILAGSVSPPYTAEEVAALARKVPGVRAALGRVPDGQLQTLYKAADFAVLPYKDILTSGSALAAMSFACPVIGPALPALTDYVADGAGALLYRPGSPGGLLTALRRAMLEDADRRAGHRSAALEAVRPHTWSGLARTLVDALESRRDRPAGAAPLADGGGVLRRHAASVVEQGPGAGLAAVLTASGAGPAPAAPRLRLAHIVNLYRKGDGLDAVQRHTVAAMRAARAATPAGIAVHPVAVPMAGETDLVPEGFTAAAPLARTARDLPTLETDRPLPLLFDVLAHGIAAAEAAGAEAIVLTNADICPLPHFYTLAAELLGSGVDAVTLNRRTVPQPPPGLDTPGLLASEYGQTHPGFDCFIFRRALYERFVASDSVLGAGMVMRALLFNLAAVAARFVMLTTAHATYHLGDDQPWKSPAFAALEAHNVEAALSVGRHWLDDPDRGAVFRAFCRCRPDPVTRRLV
ncbi:glycosyltransferase family 4 protein [Roseospira goensis]|uniref:Glycosyltransferase involved in cell wall biosynthesis n=1 Tax=Roseospira goensis TaxID=391922 RepID=A0A7W6RXM7_9PROT|nr:glycosyltransferase family 4 protein [Roseospira goensis]MBB4284620.1 glycosyltransferase involved in cell wall biosynthesis [Roseospira goensis]